MNIPAKAGEILLINKPKSWTSFDAVKKVKNILRAKKVGHAGTLDPLAEGLLIICTENKTKEIAQIQDAEKEYTGTLVLGATTPSYDLETEVSAAVDVSHITPEKIENALVAFRGDIEQAPPLYSAMKIDGKRAYELARGGIEHQMKKRTVSIKQFEIVHIQLPEIQFKVVCSKGTYIRSLAHDLGQTLGCGAYLSQLTRTRIGNYHLIDAFTPEELLRNRNPKATREDETSSDE